MGNNSRGNRKMQNTMHELPYGGNTSKARLARIKYLPMFIAIWFVDNRPLFLSLWSISALIAIYLYEPKKVSEPKTVTRINPYYNADRTRLLCMLRNAQKSKKEI